MLIEFNCDVCVSLPSLSTQAYYVCRNLDNSTEVELINETVYEIVQLLIMDEDPTVPVDTYDNQDVGGPEHEKEEVAAVSEEQRVEKEKVVEEVEVVNENLNEVD